MVPAPSKCITTITTTTVMATMVAARISSMVSTKDHPRATLFLQVLKVEMPMDRMRPNERSEIDWDRSLDATR